MIPSVPIVVVGYNRPEALQRLLNSLLKAEYPDEVRLIISVDGDRETGRQGDKEKGRPGDKGTERQGDKEKGRPGDGVRKVAADFVWPFGEKKLIFHKDNLGLREHVLSCGDLSKDHDGIIVLEDDLVVSPVFYQYAVQAFQFYRDDPGIAGISLYSHAYNETAQFPFSPLNDGSDVFFLQYASSWGQFWSRESWKMFREWYDRNSESKSGSESLPPNIRLWPANSWKKYFISYLISHGLYFVYPRVSLTTIFSDQGTNIRIRETFLQVPLQTENKEFKFRALNESSSVYDVYCEIIPDRLKRLVPELRDHDFDTDLYGMKSGEKEDKGLFLSSRKCSNPAMTFGREMKPHEMNIAWRVPGKYFSLGSKKDFEEPGYFIRLLKCHEKSELAYWYTIREYHFYKNRLLTTEKSSSFYLHPGFSFRKLRVMAGFAFRYFRK